MICPQCNEQCWRDEVDIGIDVQCGPWRCQGCGWYEGYEIDMMIDSECKDRHVFGDSDKQIRLAEDIDLMLREKENGCR
jgi:hypothetical protein